MIFSPNNPVNHNFMEKFSFIGSTGKTVRYFCTLTNSIKDGIIEDWRRRGHRWSTVQFKMQNGDYVDDYHCICSLD